ncbi:hypothetical protein Lfu02_47710 [Longispora fulva]|uniref:Uncharacterized protein n=1 Tax=Longispora fulva TaxID=619741 RepID=A0A8J7GHK9_9ACTN|nr:hypothetical protein [Longispora fulva]MBG6138146.1 hypothetical protein [Longispora fulva]GIG60399.1 hypothetical protein Lfu02_47710 [Longispora fulva]
MQDNKEATTVERRRLLRGGAAALAGVAGAGVALTAGSPAEAATGQAVVAGQENTADVVTTLTASTSAGALKLANSAGAPLVLAPSGVPVPNGSPLGALGSTENGFLLQSVPTREGSTLSEVVYSSYFASMVIPTAPTRILDTRDAGLRGSIVEGQAYVNPQTGQVAGGKVIRINMGSLVQWGIGVQMNVTVVAGGVGGFVSVWGSKGDRPNASSLNFSGGNILSNFVQSQLISVVDSNNAPLWTDTVKVYAHTNTAIIIDVVGFIVDVPWRLVASGVAAPGQMAVRRPAGVAIDAAPEGRQFDVRH